jgi:SAM-dependent methyltransferase
MDKDAPKTRIALLVYTSHRPTLKEPQIETYRWNRSILKAERSSPYWDAVSLAFTQNSSHSLWRSYSDQLNRSLLKSWMVNRRMASILKTDAFDEAVDEGLYPLLQEYAAVVHAIDIAPESVNAAAKRYPDFAVHYADVRDLAFADGSFDMVVSNSTLDHFRARSDIDKSLQELFRVLKAGGELVISLDNLQNPIIWVRSVLPFGLLKKLHLVPYYVGKSCGRQGLIAALERAGFEVLETRAIMHCPRFLAVPLAGIVQKRVSREGQKRFLALLAKFEVLAAWPSRFFTGHFVAARALKPLEKAVSLPPE